MEQITAAKLLMTVRTVPDSPAFPLYIHQKKISRAQKKAVPFSLFSLSFLWLCGTTRKSAHRTQSTVHVTSKQQYTSQPHFGIPRTRFPVDTTQQAKINTCSFSILQLGKKQLYAVLNIPSKRKCEINI